MAEMITGALRRAGEVIQPWATAVVIEGGSMALIDYGLNMFKKYKYYATIKNTLKQWTEPVLSVLISLVSIVLAYAQLPEYGIRAVRVIGSWGVYKAIVRIIGLEPSIYIGKSEIEVFGLDPNKTVEVYIDGTKQTFTTPPSTDSRGYAKITLTITEGEHKVLVHSSFKAVYSHEYVG